jgi:hypothetical protein
LPENATLATNREDRMRSRRQAPPDGLKYLAEPVIAAIGAERAQVEGELGHLICGRYLGDRDGHPNVCWKSRGHGGTHL